MEIPINPYEDPLYADFHVTTEVSVSLRYH